MSMRSCAKGSWAPAFTGVTGEGVTPFLLLERERSACEAFSENIPWQRNKTLVLAFPSSPTGARCTTVHLAGRGGRSCGRRKRGVQPPGMWDGLPRSLRAWPVVWAFMDGYRASAWP